MDEEKFHEFLNRFVGDLGAAVAAGGVVLGDQLGLYAALAEGPQTPDVLAANTGTAPRYVEEWLRGQAAGGYVEYDASAGTSHLTDEQAFALTNPDGPAFLPGAFQLAIGAMHALPRLADAFRTGEGVGWHEHDEDVFVGCERFFRAGYSAHLVAEWLPALDGVVARLEAGATVADVGCGLGASTALMAQAFPNSTFTGSGLPHPLHRAGAQERRRGVAWANAWSSRWPVRATFADGPYDLVTTFDCLHDMGDPVAAAEPHPRPTRRRRHLADRRAGCSRHRRRGTSTRSAGCSTGSARFSVSPTRSRRAAPTPWAPRPVAGHPSGRRGGRLHVVPPRRRDTVQPHLRGTALRGYPGRRLGGGPDLAPGGILMTTTSRTSDRHRSFVAAMAIDSVAAGVFQPATFIFLLATTHLGLPEIGTALTVAGLLALPVGLWSGRIVDDLGPKPVLMVANVAQTVGVAGYLVLHSFWGVVACAWVASSGRGVFFGTFGVALSAIAGPGERERWFGRIGGIRNLGQAAGGLVAGAALAVGTHAAYTALIVLTAASFLGAVPLMRQVPRPIPDAGAPAPVSQSWAAVLRDRQYWIVVAHWMTFVFSGNVLTVAIPVYAAVVLGMPGWVAGAAFTVNTLLIGFGQNAAVRRLDGRVRSRVMAASHLGYAAGYVVLLGASLASGAVAIGILMLGVAVYTFGETIGWPVSSALAAEAAPAELRGRYLALFQLSGSSVGATAPVILSGLLALGAATTWLPLLAVCAAGSGLASLAGRRVPAAAVRIGHHPATNQDEQHKLAPTSS